MDWEPTLSCSLTQPKVHVEVLQTLFAYKSSQMLNRTLNYAVGMDSSIVL